VGNKNWTLRIQQIPRWEILWHSQDHGHPSPQTPLSCPRNLLMAFLLFVTPVQFGDQPGCKGCQTENTQFKYFSVFINGLTAVVGYDCVLKSNLILPLGPYLVAIFFWKFLLLLLKMSGPHWLNSFRIFRIWAQISEIDVHVHAFNFTVFYIYSHYSRTSKYN
jgi:hypothetical protein